MTATITQLLPGPSAASWDWQLLGACRDHNTELFYHPEGERGRARMERERKAKAICNSCPVLAACRSHALAVAEPFGIWGGMTEQERMLALRTRRRNAR